MPSELSIIGRVGLGLMVKKVKGKLYVYEYVRVNGKPIVKYVGPLEEIVRAYEALKAGLTVNQAWKPRELRRLAQYIVDNLMGKGKAGWWTGRDLNPGPLGCKPSTRRELLKSSTHKVIQNASVCVEITDGLVKDFEQWLRKDNPRVRESTVRQYMYYIPRLVGVKLCGKEDVSKAFKRMGGVKKSSYEAFSRFLTFLEKTRDLDALVAKLRKALPKKPKARADTYVPPDSKVAEVREAVRASGDPALKLFYNVLVSTGCRGTEARYLIKNIRKLRAVELPYGAVRIHVDLQRGSKNEFVMYLPKEVYQQLLEFRGRLRNQDNMEKALAEAGLNVKYFRKWWRQTAKKAGIDSEDVEAFQGRVSSVGGRHYTDWIPILDKDYEYMLPHIRKFIIR